MVTGGVKARMEAGFTVRPTKAAVFYAPRFHQYPLAPRRSRLVSGQCGDVGWLHPSAHVGTSLFSSLSSCDFQHSCVLCMWIDIATGWTRLYVG